MEIDINCDLGEGLGNDHAIMPYISSCNIACGGHAGDSTTMRKTIALAKKHHVKIGAHPSYPDRANFGRNNLDISAEELTITIRDQIQTLRSLEVESQVQLNHIKLHGALYNEVTINQEAAKPVLEAVKNFGNKVQLYVPYGSVIAELAHLEGIQIKHEGFADRAYKDNLQLVSRADTNALLHDPSTIYTHVSGMIRNQEVRTISNKTIKILVDTICVHGDNPNAVEIVKFLYEKLTAEGIRVK